MIYYAGYVLFLLVGGFYCLFWIFDFIRWLVCWWVCCLHDLLVVCFWICLLLLGFLLLFELDCWCFLSDCVLRVLFCIWFDVCLGRWFCFECGLLFWLDYFGLLHVLLWLVFVVLGVFVDCLVWTLRLLVYNSVVGFTMFVMCGWLHSIGCLLCLSVLFGCICNCLGVVFVVLFCLVFVWDFVVFWVVFT